MLSNFQQPALLSASITPAAHLRIDPVYRFILTLLYTMVVVQPEPSTSTTVHKKTRRSTKKKAPRIASADGEDLAMEGAPAPAPAPDAGGDELMIDEEEIAVPTDAPDFGPAPASVTNGALKSESRRIPIPPHRMSPLKKEWVNIFGPLTEMLGLQVRMNMQRKAVEIRVSLG